MPQEIALLPVPCRLRRFSPLAFVLLGLAMSLAGCSTETGDPSVTTEPSTDSTQTQTTTTVSYAAFTRSKAP